MTARNYHTPPQPGSNRVRCPVCHEAVYSRAGIHPQCAVRQSEPPRTKAAPQAPAAEIVEDVLVEVIADVEAIADPVIDVIVPPAPPAPRAARRRPA